MSSPSRSQGLATLNMIAAGLTALAVLLSTLSTLFN